jgi:hypothetical protein
MAVSFAENARLTCPACANRFDADVWTLVDSTERPDLLAALRDGSLNLVTCPRCGLAGPAGAPLLLHDPQDRQVYFASPPGASEYEVREQAQALLYVLVGSLPEEARLPYIGDVQVEQELEGVRRAVEHRSRRRGTAEGRRPEPIAPATVVPTSPPTKREPAPTPPAPADPSPILDAVRALLAADTADEIATLIDNHPQLLDPAADAVIAGLADAAYGQGEPEVAQALAELRQMLRDWGGRDQETASASQAAVAGGVALPYGFEPPAPGPPPSPLSDTAFRSLMLAETPGDLAEVVRGHPSLLETWADAEIGLRGEAALDEGNERQAQAIEARRESLAALRDELTDEAVLVQALQELVRAGDAEEALAQTLAAFPGLLTSDAQDALFRLAAEARARSDDALATRAVEYRAMLRKVREGLEEQ